MVQIHLYKKVIFLPIFIALLIVCGACKKEKDAVTPNQYIIKGTALFKDYYKGTIDLVPFANKPVFIRVDSAGSNKDTSNHFYSVQTGTDGRFNFYLSDSTLHYEVFTLYSVRSSNSFSPNYYGSVFVGTDFSHSDYHLIASVDTVYENGLNIITQDINGERIPNAQGFIYSSQILAIADSSFSGTGNVLGFKTDSLGKAFVSNLPPGNLYINSVLTLTDTTNLKVLNAVVHIQLHQIAVDTLKLN